MPPPETARIVTSAPSGGTLAGAVVDARAAPVAPRALALATLGHVLATTAQSTFIFFLAPAFTRHFGVTHLDRVAFSATAVATLLVALPAGRLSDTRGRRPVMRAGWWTIALGCAAVAVPLALGAGAPGAWLVAATLLTGAGLGLAFTAFMSYVADALRGAALSRSYGRVAAFAILASALGPFAAAALVARAPTSAAGLLAVALFLAALAAAAALASYALPSARAPGAADAAAGAAGATGRRKRDALRFLVAPRSREERAVVAMNVAFLAMGGSFGATVPYLAVHFLDARGLATPAWGALLGAGTALGAVAAWASGKLVARVGGRRLLPAIALAVGALVAALAWAPLLLVAAGLYLARSVAAFTTGPVMNSMLMDEAGSATKGEAMGASVVAWNVGWAAGAFSGGAALATWGAAASFPVAGALGVAGAVAAVALMPRAGAAEAAT